MGPKAKLPQIFQILLFKTFFIQPLKVNFFGIYLGGCHGNSTRSIQITKCQKMVTPHSDSKCRSYKEAPKPSSCFEIYCWTFPRGYLDVAVGQKPFAGAWSSCVYQEVREKRSINFRVDWMILRKCYNFCNFYFDRFPSCRDEMIGDRDKGHALTPVDLSAATWKKPKLNFHQIMLI